MNATSASHIRPFRAGDAAPLAEWMDQLAPAEDVYTAALLVHQRGMLPRRRNPLWLVAIVGGEPVGLAREEPQIFGNRPGLRRTWVGVRPDRRGRGIGTELWQRLEAHAREVGGDTLRSWAAGNQPDGKRFLLAHGFARVRRELQSWVDPRSVDAHEFEQAAAAARGQNLELRSLREVLPHQEREVRRLFLDADRDVPGHTVHAKPLAANTFRRVILRHPLLDQDCSVVVLRAGAPVALCWLKGDKRIGRYGVEFTATAPAWRGHGLATLAKLAALQRAASAGLRWVGTANDEDNAPMLAVNRKLGHRPLADLLTYERAL